MISSLAESINALWADLLIEELLRHGIDQFVLSPGSRCAPITAAIARRTEARKVVHFDERGAAFFALGYAKATGKPAVLVCTSGTATANYYPAIIEASMDRTPMIVLTADRPPELHGIGANQTIDQQRLYGGFVREEIQMPCPTEKIPARLVVGSVDSAVARATGMEPGPVHLNLPFREPLAPLGPKTAFSAYLESLGTWMTSESALLTPVDPSLRVSHVEIDGVIADLSKPEDGLVVVGPLANSTESDSVRSLVAKLGWPVFADIRSGLRTSSSDEPIISYFDQLMLDEDLLARQSVTILHLGGVLTSKRFYQFLERADIESYVRISADPEHQDPSGRATRKIRADVAAFCEDLEKFTDRIPQSNLGTALSTLNSRVEALLVEEIDRIEQINEILVARIVSKEAGPNDLVWLGSSMPIREMDMYAVSDGHAASVAANRGASGIDGSIASFLGFVHGSAKPGIAVLGDLSTLHDLNSLALLREIGQPVTIVVVNNDGGGIFSFLPIAECTDIFDEYFGTPHGLTFEKAAAMFGLRYYQPKNSAELREHIKRSRSKGQATLIEVITSREDNIRLHNEIQRKIRDAVRSRI
jgi:2-succinyl-5-enolpyruvyl-6-hydroxy-3-cyclohexene-1-carboxylate synthase